MVRLSVVKFEKEEWDRLFTSLSHHEQLGALSIFDKERVVEVMDVNSIDMASAKDALLAWFVTQLSAVNQITYYYQYRDVPAEIEFIRAEKKGKPMSLAELGEQVGLVEYNCIDNNGNNFLPAFLANTLNRVQKQISSNPTAVRIR